MLVAGALTLVFFGILIWALCRAAAVRDEQIAQAMREQVSKKYPESEVPRCV